MHITNAYLDGFYLDNGALKGTLYRWLDLKKLCGFRLPSNEMKAIKYFTASVSARFHDLDQPMRQQLYRKRPGNTY